MPNTFGKQTNTTFLKEESHKLHEEFEVEGLTQTLTFSAALVTGNTTNGSVNGNAIPTKTFATDSDTSMAAIAAAIAAMPGVKSAVVLQAGSNDRVIIITPVDQFAGVALTGFAVTNGASQATITAATSNKKIYKGMPVEINATSGKIQPVTPATHDLTCIGYALHDAIAGGLCTVACRGYGIIYAKSATDIAYGPVKFDSYDAVNGYNLVEDGSVTTANQFGWTLDDTLGAGETVRVIIKA